MKKLVKFLLESDSKGLDLYIEQTINEATFTNADWRKSNDSYGRDVIDALVAGKSIRLGKNGSEGEYKATTDEIEKLKSINPDFTDTSLNQFNNVFGKKLKWSQIFKGAFSGHEKQSSGQMYESLVCYIFNGGTNYQDWAVSVGLTDLDPNWVRSCELTVEFMNKHKWAGCSWNNDTYVACHVDGHDFDFDNKYQFALEVTKMFHDKKDATKILGVNCNNLYSGQKDTWNKADIVIIKKDATNIIQDLKAIVSDGQSLNAELCCKLAEGIIIPLSLKKVSDLSKVHVTGFNISDAEEQHDNDFEDADIVLADKYQDNVYIGNVRVLCTTLDNEQKEINFRKDTNPGNNLSVETKSNKMARDGKAMATIKSALSLGRSDSYYIVMNSDEAAIKELEKYGFDVNIPKKSNYKELDPPLHERACIAGLLGILSEYRKKKHPKLDKDFPMDFAKFCYLCSIQGTGAFFKISE